MRWRWLLPSALAMAVIGGFGTFFVVSALVAARVDVAARLSQQSAIAALDRARDQFDQLRTEAARVAYTQGVADALQARAISGLVASLRSLMTLSELEWLTLLDATGTETLTLRTTGTAITPHTNARLDLEPALTRLLAGNPAESFLLQTAEDIFIVVGVPIVDQQRVIGAALVGQSLRLFVNSINASSVSHVMLYAPDGVLLAHTQAGQAPALPDSVRQQALSGLALSVELNHEGATYQAVALPWVMGRNTLGVLAALVPEALGAHEADQRPFVAGLAALMAVGALGTVAVGARHAARHLDAIAETAYALARGRTYARTHLQPHDEIGRVGHAVDTLARATQHREDQLRDMLTRERRERAYLVHLLESLPEGVLIYTLHGQLLTMNERARALLNGQPLALPQEAIAAQASSCRLSTPVHIHHDARVLAAQAAEITVRGGQTLGYVVLLRDVTDQARRQQLHATLVEHMALPTDALTEDTVATPRQRFDPVVGEFMREVARHAAVLQKMIVDMQALTQYSAQSCHRERVMAADTLLWAVANDWRQIAHAANLTLQVTVQRKGLLIRGDESRLRLALGNLIDNAIKYTPAGGTVTLEIERETASHVHVRVRDNGVGIHEQDLKHLFTPFYRGTPTDESGQVLRVPGLGQGLVIARQIIEAHGGQIKVKSRAGTGTAVYLSLPLVPSATPLPLSEPFLHEGDTVVISLPQVARRLT